MRERTWIEYSKLGANFRSQVDMNRVVGEPKDQCARHTPQLDYSGDLWLPGFEPKEET